MRYIPPPLELNDRLEIFGLIWISRTEYLITLCWGEDEDERIAHSRGFALREL